MTHARNVDFIYKSLRCAPGTWMCCWLPRKHKIFKWIMLLFLQSKKISAPVNRSKLFTLHLSRWEFLRWPRFIFGRIAGMCFLCNFSTVLSWLGVKRKWCENGNRTVSRLSDHDKQTRNWLITSQKRGKSRIYRWK